MPWHDRSLDLVVLTHPQRDHGTGLIDVFERYDVERALLSNDDGSLLTGALADAAAEEGADVRTASAGQRFDLGDGVTLDVLWPPPDLAPGTSPNNAGVVLELSWRDVSFLLAADIESATEQALTDARADLSATVLKVAHHGSKTSSTTAFLDAVQPQVAVVSSGLDNRFGHPASDVVNRIDDYAKVYNTATDGDVSISTDGARLWIDTGR
jgi:competence protein ComEC